MAWYDKQPDGKRYELLDGIVHELQSERVAHARAKARVHTMFSRQIARRKLPCEALPDGMAVRVYDDVVFEPDALVRCGPLLHGNDVIVIDPVIVVEVASPSTQSIDALHKLTLYFRNPHIIHYLIVLPARKMVIHHRRLADGQMHSAIAGEGAVTFDPPGLTLDVTDLFSDT